MIVVIKLVTGESIIGAVQYTSIDQLLCQGTIRITDPMSIDRDEDGMKLRDSLMLSEQEVLIFRQDDIITSYIPITPLVDYYTKALVYAKSFTKPNTISQISEAIQDIEFALKQEEETKTRLAKLFMQASGGNGTIQ